MRFLERLNRPAAVLFALALLLTIGGFLLFANFNSTSVNPSDGSVGETGEGSSMESDTTGETTSGTMDNAASEETVASDETTSEGYADDLSPFSPRRPSMEARVQECNEGRDQESCIEELVADAAPQAEYVGTRTELNKEGSERNEKVIY